MAKYKLMLTHATRDGQGVHIFEADDDLLTHSPVTVMRTTMAAMEHEGPNIGHIDFQLYSCLKDKDTGVVSALGDLIFNGTQSEPFTALISKAD